MINHYRLKKKTHKYIYRSKDLETVHVQILHSTMVIILDIKTHLFLHILWLCVHVMYFPT